MMAINVKRAGVTARYWTTTGAQVRVQQDLGKKVVGLLFEIASKGGGYTQIRVEISPESFTEVVTAMVLVDTEAAAASFGAALVEGFSNPPE
jgi:hypothetical protein